LLVVTEKNTNLILAYQVASSGVATPAKISQSAGVTPFGFEFDPAGHLVVSEASGGAPDASSVSSYEIGANRKAIVIDGPIATSETAACWLVVTDDGRYAYIANTGSDSITGFRLEPDGALSILDTDGVTALTGDVPIDLALSDGSEYLYSLGSGSDTITVFRAESDGTLSLVQTVAGLPATAVGLAAG
jgi:6-phosphogluconolactonase (cycloisomerase 2 family)